MKILLACLSIFLLYSCKKTSEPAPCVPTTFGVPVNSFTGPSSGSVNTDYNFEISIRLYGTNCRDFLRLDSTVRSNNDLLLQPVVNQYYYCEKCTNPFAGVYTDKIVNYKFNRSVSGTYTISVQSTSLTRAIITYYTQTIVLN